jgi:hypothetical protein
MKTIAFHSNQLSVTGTEVALYDYAHYNETLLGNRSVVLHHRLNPNNHPDALAKFSKRFEVLTYDHVSELDDVLHGAHAELLYAIKAGKKDGLVSKRIPTMVHAVFPTAPWQVHGSAYAFISEWLSKECSANEIPTVPHIVSMPDVEGDLRTELNIPANALVLGCYGGARSYDVPCAVEGAKQLLKDRGDVYFIFMHLIPFLDHPRAIFLPGTTDMERKTRFINTCDAMVHARKQGESFGLACGEFSVRNKPVLTYKHCKHTHHLDVLGDKGMLYEDTEQFIGKINSLNRDALPRDRWDRYTHRYNPERVMELFEKYFIHPSRQKFGKISPMAHIKYILKKIKVR